MKHTRLQIENAIKHWTNVLHQLDENVQDDIENLRKNPPGVSGTPGTIAFVIRNNMEKFNTCKTKDQLVKLCKEIFDQEGIDSGRMKWLFTKLEQQPNIASALMFLANRFQNGSGLSMDMNPYKRGTGIKKVRYTGDHGLDMDSIFGSKK